MNLSPQLTRNSGSRLGWNLKSYLQKLKITVVYVTHNLSEAFIMSDRIAVMGNGRIEQIGCGAEIFDKPSSSYVAKFLGVNAFKGKAVKFKAGLMEIDANGVLLLAPSAPNLVGKTVAATLKPENITFLKISRLSFQWRSSEFCRRNYYRDGSNEVNRANHSGHWFSLESETIFKHS